MNYCNISLLHNKKSIALVKSIDIISQINDIMQLKFSRMLFDKSVHSYEQLCKYIHKDSFELIVKNNNETVMMLTDVYIVRKEYMFSVPNTFIIDSGELSGVPKLKAFW